MAILLYVFAALYFGIHFAGVASGLRGLDATAEATYFADARWLLGLWAFLVFAAVALGFARGVSKQLTQSRQRSVVIASCIAGLLAAIAFEWWNALYFLLAAYVLAASTRTQSHA